MPLLRVETKIPVSAWIRIRDDDRIDVEILPKTITKSSRMEVRYLSFKDQFNGSYSFVGCGNKTMSLAPPRCYVACRESRKGRQDGPFPG